MLYNREKNKLAGGYKMGNTPQISSPVYVNEKCIERSGSKNVYKGNKSARH